MPEIVSHPSAAKFLDRAQAWLLQKEAQNNLILSVARGIAEQESDREENLFVTVEDGDSVVGCAFRTPPWKLFVTDCPEGAVESLVELVYEKYPHLGAVYGVRDPARSYAIAWARRFAMTFRQGMYQRVYQLEHLNHPDSTPSGNARPVMPEEKSLLVGWMVRFYTELGFPIVDVEESAGRLIEARDAWFWCDPEPVSLGVYTGYTPSGVRIGSIFTPPELRRSGYATAVTAAMAQNALESGLERCFLFADVDNPTSNKIYRKIGFEPVVDVVDYLFEPQR